MKIVIAIDSFKGSLSSLEAGNSVKNAVLTLEPDAEVHVCPLADGGEGTVDALAVGLDGKMIETVVTGPLGTAVNAKYCIIKNEIAVIEMAAAAGITLVPPKNRDPLKTTTYGVGELISDAIDRGCRSFIIGIGGSATNDGGTGMLSALGVKFLDKNKNKIPLGAKGLSVLDSICIDSMLPELRDCTFRIACDVKNPLCGELGCSAVYGPQKGADEESIVLMDSWLSNYAKLTKAIFPATNPDFEGTGAAGGLGFAFLSYLGASLESGIKIILDQIELESLVKDCDIVVTGEGRLDSQTVMGKAPIGVAMLAKKYSKRVIAFAGCVTKDAYICNNHGIDAFFPILREVTSLDEALDKNNAYENLYATAYQVFRLIMNK